MRESDLERPRSMVSPALSRTAGLLLAGGRSSRFGAEKALAQFRGASMMEAVAERFAGCGALAVSARPSSATERRALALSLTVLHDPVASPCGPLSGVCAGMMWAEANGFDLLATAPCDSPLLPRNLFQRLLNGLGEAAAAFAVTSSGAHPLCAVWRRRLLAPLQRSLSQGVHPSARAFLRQQGAVGVFFQEAAAFANANTMAALSALERAA